MKRLRGTDWLMPLQRTRSWPSSFRTLLLRSLRSRRGQQEAPGPARLPGVPDEGMTATAALPRCCPTRGAVSRLVDYCYSMQERVKIKVN